MEAQANTQHASGFTLPLETENCRTNKSRAREDAVLDGLRSRNWRQRFGEDFVRPGPGTVRSSAVHSSNGGKIEIPSDNQELPQSGEFSNSAKRIAFGALYTIAFVTDSIAAFSIVSGGRNADPAVTRIQSGLSIGTEVVAIPGLTAERSETVAEIRKSNEPVMTAYTSRAPELSQTVKLGSAVSSPLPSDTAQMRQHSLPTQLTLSKRRSQTIDRTLR